MGFRRRKDVGNVELKDFLSELCGKCTIVKFERRMSEQGSECSCLEAWLPGQRKCLNGMPVTAFEDTTSILTPENKALPKIISQW